MSEAKFTKGDWVIYPLEDDKEYIRIRGSVVGGRFKIADVRDLHLHHDEKQAWCKCEREESMANAHLIAAAPEMYEILEMLTSMPTYDAKCFLESEDSIVKLLAKARGEI